MKEMTIEEFNDKYVRCKFNYKDYELMTDEDVGFFFIRTPNPRGLSLFSEWTPSSSLEALTVPFGEEAIKIVDIKVHEMTIDEFNKEFGVTTYGIERYKMVDETDVGTYVCKKHEGYTIPYFCEWEQRTKPFTLNEDWGETIKILPNV